MPLRSICFRIRNQRILFLLLIGLFLIFLVTNSCIFWSSQFFSGDRLSSQYKQKALKYAEEYVKLLSNQQTLVQDGPYNSIETHYDLKKTLAVLLENMLERLDKVEKRLSIFSNSSLDLSALTAADILRGAQEQCNLPLNWNLTNPVCLEKLKWMETFWQSDPCYGKYGVDGSRCSFLIYLSEVESYCPRFVWRLKKAATPIPYNREAKPRTDITGLWHLMKDNPKNFEWIKIRIERLWPKWIQALKNLEKRQGYTFKQREKRKILLHMGFLTKESGFKFGEKSLRGGPLGELVQWSDLIACLYIVGHDLIISSELNTFKSYAQADETLKSSCPVLSGDKLDIIFTDIVGVKQIRKKIPASLQNYKCRLRILDSFGTQAEFNDVDYFKLHKEELAGNKKNPWGGHMMDLQQFYNMFPHSPDNTFLGFVVETFDDNVTVTEDFTLQPEKKDWALVYGKENYMWKDLKPYIDEISKVLEVHATVVDPGPDIPKHVVNHGILSGPDLHELLKKVKLFIGLGFPYEGPAPLEAIANGAIFLNPKFTTPKGRKTDKFFAEKPTLRLLTSQNPYAEVFIGKPHVLTIDISNLTDVFMAVEKASVTKVQPHLPFEFTHEGMLERVNALISHQDFCNPAHRNWPPFSASRMVMSEENQSCKDACWQKGLVCERSYFGKINSIENLKERLKCISIDAAKEVHAPSIDVTSGKCTLQSDAVLFSCAAEAKNAMRLCPCRDFIKDQVSLCAACL